MRLSKQTIFLYYIKYIIINYIFMKQGVEKIYNLFKSSSYFFETEMFF